MILISDIPKNVFLKKIIKLSNWKLDHDITTQSKTSKNKWEILYWDMDMKMETHSKKKKIYLNISVTK